MRPWLLLAGLLAGCSSGVDVLLKNTCATDVPGVEVSYTCQTADGETLPGGATVLTGVDLKPGDSASKPDAFSPADGAAKCTVYCFVPPNEAASLAIPLASLHDVTITVSCAPDPTPAIFSQ